MFVGMAGIYLHIPFCRKACYYCNFHFSTSFKTREEMIKAIPMRRVGEHIELANLAAYLVSDGAAYINGDAIVIDGGKMLQSGGGGANTSAMLDWTDEQWDAIRPKKK